MLCSNHEKIRFGSKIRWKFWDRKNRTAFKHYVDDHGVSHSRNPFKGRKPKTFRDMKSGDKTLQNDD